ncbi:YgaP family membrane protein [Pseudobdellovibrio exovorus]|uniref:YgaP family membrane protein n=1 Tax=Pseudobdellovibrio exovorus TaxID=453816 RepID=UPI000A02A12B|nr:DUF2892 domain-containing protein [Pseudobdellovibrio exovorus]
MLCNTALWDRAIRFLLAVGLLSYAIAGGPMWFWPVGLYLLLTSAWGLCPLYAFFKIRTLK